MKMAVNESSDSMEPVKVPHSLHSFKRIVDSTEQEARTHSLELSILYSVVRTNKLKACIESHGFTKFKKKFNSFHNQL